jgi:hypothetical protein
MRLRRTLAAIREGGSLQMGELGETAGSGNVDTSYVSSYCMY